MANILLFIDSNALHIGTVRDHLDSLKRLSRHRVVVAECRMGLVEGVSIDQFDVIAFHYSVVIARRDFVSERLAEVCASFKGLNVLLIQDEYRWINDTISAAVRLRIDVIFTVVNDDLVKVLYADPRLGSVRIERTLTGFVPQHLLSYATRAYSSRLIDVGYRGRSVPFWLGTFAQEKRIIGECFNRDAARYGLVTDISSDENDRLYKGEWWKFLTRCKAVLGTESGASILDFDGGIQQRVDAFMKNNPRATFEEVQHKFLSDIDGKHVIHVISPRCFEAAALRTLMIMYPGDYSGIMVAGRHYVSLARDHSNMAEVVDILRSPERAQRIIDRAYEEVACNHSNTFEEFARHFDRVVSEELEKKLIPFPDRSSRLVKEEQAFARELRRYVLRRKLQWWLFLFAKKMHPYIPSKLRRLLRRLVETTGLG